MSIGQAVKAPRYGFIDLLRGFALAVMVETHIVNAYIPNAMRAGSEFFFWLTFVNGLVAPGFLFASGFSLILQSDRQWDDWLHLHKPFWVSMRRLGFIVLVAYYSHLQRSRLSEYLKLSDLNVWSKSLQVDVLQCIVFSLLVVYLLIFILRNKKLLPWGLALLGVIAALWTPWMWAQDFRNTMPLPLALFLNPHGISLFPIFPWICFVLAGSCAASIFLKSVEARKESRYFLALSILGALLIAAGLLLRNAPYSLPGLASFYTTSPLYVGIRLGCVLLICALLYVLEKYRHWAPAPIRLAGQESLLVYGAHLWVIFSFLRGKRMAAIFGLEAGYGWCFLVSGLIILLMLGLAWVWHTLKKKYPFYVKTAQAITVLIIAVTFLSR